ncbi:CAP domain-containing protein [Streptomyces prasinus]|uniref:CAP domain-containing protein n=1 Tax=Streptomyces prasinus TaxID=67345 RepID=UPI0006EBDC0A|nr:CAP domain-containing protein [Streptomyces prasinus]
MSQHRASHGRARTKSVRSHAKAGGPRTRLIAASGVLLALGGAFALTSQNGSDDTGAAATGKPQGQQSVGDRAAEGNDTRVRAARAEENEAAEAGERLMDEEERSARAQAAKTARENRLEAERKNEAAAEEDRAKANREKQRQEKEREEREEKEKQAGAADAAGNGGSGSGSGSGSGGSSSIGMSADEHRLISLLNERRVALGLPPVEGSADLAGQAEECSARSLAKGALEHCGHEVLFMGGSGNTPEAMIEAWFNSPGHKTALTYGSSSKAGAAIVTNSAGRLVAAINIDY